MLFAVRVFTEQESDGYPGWFYCEDAPSPVWYVASEWPPSPEDWDLACGEK